MKLLLYYKFDSLKVAALGRGYYNLMFGSREEKAQALTKGSLDFHPGSFEVHQWVPNFIPPKE
ncbi:hypothetical protein LguiA_027177 [Lonicera macranthoides]